MTEETGSGNRWEPVGAPPPATPMTPTSPLRTRRGKGLLAGMAAALLLGGGAVGFTAAQVAGAPADDQPGQQQDVRPGLGGGDDDRGGFDPEHDDGPTDSQDET